ncbi:hypothetical protein [Salinicoccus roseus]|uniref:hypothetical protein n=1 Tax=Salinicoccus roseus TaxID=45670 RepID=UPI000F5018F0|nr:hypothetical protein [Salinicoccus roseus]GGA72588.1 hypothetical protein GCM10007176_15930 [Salinicoccus roseus]
MTNNTLLLFSRLYHHDSRVFKEFLNQLPNDEQTMPINSTIKFEQQTSANHSVPDGAITQESFKIVIETKLYGQEDIDQIIKHTDSFDGEKNKYLMLINVHQIHEDYKVKIRNKLNEKGTDVQLIDTAFEDIITSFRSVINEYDTEMSMIIDDYEDYCNGANLISIEDRLMRALPVGDTLDHNFKYKLYYAPASRSYNRRHRYLGLYTRKEIKGVGKIELIVDADYYKESKKFKWEVVEGNKDQLTDEVIDNIVQSMFHGEEEFGYQIYKGHRFFIVPEFIETKFEKVSPGGLLGAKYFDLTDYGLVKEELDTQLIAEKLKEETWK